MFSVTVSFTNCSTNVMNQCSMSSGFHSVDGAFCCVLGWGTLSYRRWVAPSRRHVLRPSSRLGRFAIRNWRALPKGDDLQNDSASKPKIP
jgi:hypothetical protein